MSEAVALRIEGMTCTSCADHVKQALEKVPGVQTASVSYPKGWAEVQADAALNP
ncbi:cation transporter, partial [Mameliella sp. CS4]